MENVKISDKGRALLNRSFTSGSVVRAIAAQGDAVSRAGGLSVNVEGRTIKVRSAGQIVRNNEHVTR